MKRNNTVYMTVLAGMFAAVGAITSWISVPVPSGVPITLQTFGMALIGFTLGWKYGTLSVLLYLSIGALGVPVFSGFMGGLGKLVGPTGGFLWGFILMAFLCGLSRTEVLQKKRPLVKGVFFISFALIGLLLCHVLGVLWFMTINGGAMRFWPAALLVSVPYLPKDILSVLAAYFTAQGALKLMKLYRHF